MKYMRKTYHVIITIFVMLVASRFAIRIVDATVQIDDDITVLLVRLTAVNAAIGVCSYMLYRKRQRWGRKIPYNFSDGRFNAATGT